jgi:hypothetical protein
MGRKRKVPQWLETLFWETQRCENMTSDELIAEIDSTKFASDEGLLKLLQRGCIDRLLEHYKDDTAFCQHIKETDEMQKWLDRAIEAQEKSGRRGDSPEEKKANRRTFAWLNRYMRKYYRPN